MSDSETSSPPQTRAQPSDSDDGDSSAGERRESWLASDRVQALANVLTVVVALTAIALSIWQGYEMRMQNRLAVIPKLKPVEATMRSATPIENEYFFLPSRRDSLYAVGYSLENTGLGPAVLHNIMEYEDGEKVFDAAESDRDYYPGRYKDDLDALAFPTGTVNGKFSVGEMLQADQVHHLITVIVPFSPEGEVYKDSLRRWPPKVVQDEALERRSTVFCYCSVYEEHCAQTHLGGEVPVENACGF